jgi:predicted metal-binding membrane protein
MRHRWLLSASIVALTALAWLALWTLGGSAHASMHHHHHGAAVASAAPLQMPLFIGSWMLMTMAMMLPTTLPLLAMFQTIAGGRRDQTLLIALAVLGYLGIWAAFGTVVYVGQQAGQRLALGSSAILLLAGVYQFTPLKHRCLDKCRSPLSFVMSHWQGRRERWHALRLGADHGLFCVGCCWTLMLLMFVVGMTNLAWMLGLAAVMAIEKNAPWGRRLSAPLGVILLAWCGVTLIML